MLGVKERGERIRGRNTNKEKLDEEVRGIAKVVAERMGCDEYVWGHVVRSLKGKYEVLESVFGVDGPETEGVEKIPTGSFADRSRAVVGAYLAGGEDGDHFLGKLLTVDELMDVSEDAVKVIEYALATEKGRSYVKDVLEGKFQVIESKFPERARVISCKIGAVSKGSVIGVLESAFDEMKAGRMEALMALSGKTEVKEAISRRIKDFIGAAPEPGSEDASGANELAWCSVAANLVVTIQHLRKEAFKGKDFTEEQYDQIMAVSKQKDPNEEKVGVAKRSKPQLFDAIFNAVASLVTGVRLERGGEDKVVLERGRAEEAGYVQKAGGDAGHPQNG